MSLASHVDKIRSLETMLAEHEAIKREVGSLRELMEERKREMDTSRGRSGSPSGRRQYGHDDDSHYMSDDDDNVHSVSTIVPHELDRVDEEDEEQLATEEKRSSRGSGGKSWVARACQSQRERVCLTMTMIMTTITAHTSRNSALGRRLLRLRPQG
ncbi:hypothetical protein POSPLADRAFT_1152873 [Postia placenta MAD-698-R-SB12]|uniref:Uncharacterized protein n=1 Tax=Postia placenta MAD-698-R-SB12 TaxID=670580 RepID=A0A1X6MRB8_9APHY|nr:hypothetical protein POSPLADRAFT_1152873 [Postia placenta MAD-698-R-SB12]OSX58712.1 hypothetical protein POSPLADRAFT_1152873 [Postia placenta MAD-698-R-SB12]